MPRPRPPRPRHGPGTRPARAATGVDLRALEIFVAVVESGSMTAAAKRLSVSQPAVSLAIAHLEEVLEGPLLDRTTRPVRPTSAGVVLLRRALRLLADMRALRHSVETAGERPLPGIRIGLVASITALGAPLIVALQQLADDLRIGSTLTPDLRLALEERKLDVVVTSEPLDTWPGLDRRVVLREPFVLAIPREYAATRRDTTLAALASNLPHIRYTSRSSIGEVIQRHLARRRLSPPRGLEFDSSAAVLDMVAAGLGWAMTTPLCLLQSGVALDSVAWAPLDGSPLERTLYAIGRRDEPPDAVGRIRDVVARLARETMQARLSGRHAWIARDVRYD